jgi:Na+/H+ antiporter NhaD/arsenite permease-like protein
MTVLAIAIFCLTYLLIASRRLAWLPIGRPAGALLGAVLMVAAGVLSPAESFAAIDFDTLTLLFGMMLLVAYLQEAGSFDALVRGLLARFGSPWRLLVGVSLAAAGLSALLVNDTICLILTPLVVGLCRRTGLPMGPFLIALATSANLGSAATLVGNPQNMIIASLSQMGFSAYLARVGPAVLAGLLVQLGLLWLYYGRRLPKTFPTAPGQAAALRPGSWLPALVCAAVVIAFFAGAHLGYAALAGALVLMLVQRREPTGVLARVDWSLLVFFAALFIVVQGLASTGLVSEAWRAAGPHLRLTDPVGLGGFVGFMTLGSNLISNVPMVLLTGPWLAELGAPERGFALLGFVTTVAGNLTLLGSVANIIVAEQAKAEYELGFFEYLRFGLVSTLACLAIGVPLVVFTT